MSPLIFCAKCSKSPAQVTTHIVTRTPDVERLRLRSRVNELFTRGRSAAGGRSIKATMQEEGEQIGRFKGRSLMRELALVSKQPGSHAYKRPQWSGQMFRTS